MNEGFWYGLIGGIFGPPIARWMGKFKYWTIFFVAMMATHIGLFIAGAYKRGLQFAVDATLKGTFTLPGILVPMGIGLLSVFVVFMGSLGSPPKK